MLVAIASDDGVHVAPDPGRCGGFVVFEIGASSAVRVGYRSNLLGDENNAYVAGQDTSAVQTKHNESLIAALSDCSALIARSVNDALVRALKNSAIAAHLFPGSSVDQAADLFRKGCLEKCSVKTIGRVGNPHLC